MRSAHARPLGSIVAIVILLAGPMILLGCGEKNRTATEEGEGKVLYWRSSMDPSFISQRPGKDAMGMDLVPVYKGDPGADLRSIVVPGATQQMMGIRTRKVERRQLNRSIRSVATIAYNERSLSEVNMKFDGWIEELYVRETGQFVDRGSPLFKIYSPELVATAEEYLLATQQGIDAPHMEHLVRSARLKLEQFDLPPQTIDEIRTTQTVPKLLTLRSFSRGYVIHKSAVEGAFVKRGEPLFKIADLDTVWVLVDVYEYDVPWLTNVRNALIQLTYIPGKVFTGTVEYVYPLLDEQSRTVKVRLALPNPGLLLKPGMFATVELQSVTPKAVAVVPSEAVIHSGRRDLVFLRLGGGRFEPREIHVGREGDGGDYEVLSGLEEGDEVVTSGQFLLDSESRLKEAVAKMLGTTVSDSSIKADSSVGRVLQPGPDHAAETTPEKK